MSARTRPPLGLFTARWGWQPDAWLQHGLPTWRPGRAPRGLVTSQQLRAAGVHHGDVAAAGQLHRPTPTRGPRGVVALWDLDEVRAHAALTTYHRRTTSRTHVGGTDDTQEHTVMGYEPLVDAWHDSRQDRTPLRPDPRRRSRWASLEHAVAGGRHRDDRMGVADTTPGRPRGPIQTEGPGIDDIDTHDDPHSFDLDDPDGLDLDATDLDATEADDGHQPKRHDEPEDEPEDDPELGDDEAGDDDEEPAA